MSETKTKNEQTINIFSNTVRDKEISSNDFALILYFKKLIWESGDRYTFETTSEDMRRSTGLSDKSINPSLKKLFEKEYLLREIGKRKPHQPIKIVLNEKKFNIEKRADDEYYTILPIKVFYSLSDGKLNTKHIRFLYYIKSYINYTDNTRQNFCYAGQRTRMIHEIGMTEPTIRKITGELVRMNLIKVTQNKIGTSLQYKEDGTLIKNKFNNHYEIKYENLLKL